PFQTFEDAGVEPPARAPDRSTHAGDCRRLAGLQARRASRGLRRWHVLAYQEGTLALHGRDAPMTDTQTLPGPLAGLRILELADEKGQFCGKLLGDLGADVGKIEPPGGEGCRRVGPFLDDTPH